MQTEHGGRLYRAVEAGEPPSGASCVVRHHVAAPLIVVASSPWSPSRSILTQRINNGWNR